MAEEESVISYVGNYVSKNSTGQTTPLHSTRHSHSHSFANYMVCRLRAEWMNKVLPLRIWEFHTSFSLNLIILFSSMTRIMTTTTTMVGMQCWIDHIMHELCCVVMFELSSLKMEKAQNLNETRRFLRASACRAWLGFTAPMLKSVICRWKMD